MEGLDPAEGAMSETPRPSYLEYGGDKKNLLSKSWDAESRFRLQENALSLPTGEDDNALFRVKVELGLHELTAALTSLSRRIDKLEENTAPPDTKKQDEAVKELARSARCLSQALPGGNVDLSVAGGGVAMGVRLTVGINQFRMDPGIASARTRRRAIHGYFRESDEQRGGYGDRIDPAARALVIEGLACLAGKVGVETARGSKANGGRVWSSTTRATRGLSPSPPRRRKPSIHPSVGETSVASEEEQMLQGGVSRDGGDKDTRMLAPSSERDFSSLRNLALPRGFAPEGEYAPSRLEVEHLRGSLGPSLSPSPITLTGSTNGRMFPPAPAHKKSKDTRSPREESKVGRWAEGARLPEPNDGKPRNNTSASGGSNDGGGGGGGGSISSSLSSSSAVQDDSSSRAVNGASANSSALGATSGSRVEKGRALKGTRGESPDDASVVPVVASEKSVDNCDSGNKNTTQLMNAASTDTGGTRDTAGETGGASDRDVMVRMLLNAAGAAAEAEERAGGPGAHGDGQGLAKRSLRSSDGAASKAGKAGGSIQVGQDDPGNFRREVDAVRALSSHLHGSASSTSSSRSASAASCSRPATGSVNVVTAAAPAAVVRRAKATEVPKDKSGGNVSPAASSLDASENARPRSQRSLLDVADGKESPLVDGGRRSSFSCRNEVSLERDGGARLVDAQGFLDLGPASICRENSAGLAELEGRQSKGPGPEVSDPGVAELEAKLEELRKIGDRIKDEAAATMEPSVTIPSQDYSESGSPFPPSRHPHHPGQMSRSGRTRGSKPVGAAAGSAFTSAESSPYRSAVDLSSSAAPPPRPCDHQGTQPALSKLLVPPFNNAALRGEFVASLEQHLAQYEDGSRDTVEDDAPGKAGGDGNVKVNDMVAACDGDGDQDCRNGSRDRSDGTSNSVLGTVTTVREIPASCVAAEARSKRTVLTPPREVGEAANATPNATDATSGVSREETDGLMEGEGYDDKTPIEETAARMDAETSINWAQEYHDYLCSKDP